MTNNDNTNERKTMKLSEVIIENEVMVQTTTDAYRVLRKGNNTDLNSYIEQFGDVDVVAETNAGSKNCPAYSVPAFKAERDSYIANKAEYCRRWGSN